MKRGMGYQIKIWTHEGPSIKKKKKNGHMKVQEKRRDSHVLKRFNKGREIIQKEFPLIHHSHTRAHLDLIV